VDKSADLGAADGTGATGAENGLVVCGLLVRAIEEMVQGGGTEDAILPCVAQVLVLWWRHLRGR